MSEPKVPQGEVTYVNERLLYFILNDHVYVNGGIYAASVRLALPKVGDKIPFLSYKTHLYLKNIRDKAVHALSVENKGIDFSQNAPWGRYYTWLIQDYDLGFIDLFTITEMHESIKDTVSPETNATGAILWCVEKKLRRMEQNRDPLNVPNWSLNKKVPLLKCITISDCRPVQIQGRHYGEFPYWSFGCHWSTEEEVLIGYLFVHPKLGTICIKDKLETIACIIMKQNHHDLDDLINETVHVERYFIVTEIFNPNPNFNLAYICMNFEDIAVPEIFERKRGDDDSSRRFTLKFGILAKSYPNFTTAKGHHFWLHVEEVQTTYLKTEHELNTERCFLCFSRDFIQRLPILEVGNVYKLKFDKKLRGTYDVEYSRIDASLSQLHVGSEVVLSTSKQDGRKHRPDIPFLNDNTIDRILQSVGLVNFIAVLKDRKFIQSNGSRTSQSNVAPGFGLLGEKTHVLDFRVGETRTLSLYLNNWERLLMPLGLIPSVVVIVRNVYIQNNKYFKSSPLTTLEIVEYRPKVEFSSANMFDDSIWGPIVPINVIQDIPDGVLIHISASAFDIINLSVRRECNKCSSISIGSSTICASDECKGSVSVSVRFNFKLEEGNTKVRIICKDLEILAAFLGFDDEQGWRTWKHSFENFGLYYHSRNAPSFKMTHSRHSKFIRSTSNRLKRSEGKSANKISILCRKMDNSRHTNKEESLCFGLKAKIIHAN